jgi:hypothetical protein
MSLHFLQSNWDPPPSGGFFMCPHCKSKLVIKRGFFPRVYGKIQERYGVKREKAELELDQFISGMDKTKDDMSH